MKIFSDLYRLYNFWLEYRKSKKDPILNPKVIDCPKGYVVHHKDGDRYNNRKSNLEVISRAELLS